MKHFFAYISTTAAHGFIIDCADWVPADVVAKCKVTLEFCCAEKQLSNNSHASGNKMPYMWCGQLRRAIDLSSDDDDKSHLARIAFFQPGVYVVSVCARLSSSDASSSLEEVWWAPRARIVRVGDLADDDDATSE